MSKLHKVSLALLPVTALALLLAAQAPPVSRKPADNTAAPPPETTAPERPKPAAPAAPPATRDLHVPFGPMLRLTIKPTLLGLVPPDDPQGFGELFLYLRRVDGTGFTARFMVKEMVQRPAPSADAAVTPPDSAAEPSAPAPDDPRRPKLNLPRSQQAPETSGLNQPEQKSLEAVRLRRGQITSAPAAATARIENPLFWGDGDWQVSSRLLWLSREAFRGLRDTGRIAWDPMPVQAPDGADPAAFIAAVRQNLGSRLDNAELVLTNARATYPIFLNGERANLPCLTARDSAGLCDYWILDQEDNPLVLKSTFADSRDPAALTATGSGSMFGGLAAPGSGFAVVSIDFSPRLTK